MATQLDGRIGGSREKHAARTNGIIDSSGRSNRARIKRSRNDERSQIFTGGRPVMTATTKSFPDTTV